MLGGSQQENTNGCSNNGNYGTLGRNCNSGNSMASMMDEMAKTLARRRAAVEKKEPSNSRVDTKTNNLVNGVAVINAVNSEKSNTLPNQAKHSESPKSIRKRFGSASDDTMLKNGPLNSSADSANQPSSDLESVTTEIVNEIKKEMHKIKLEIIEGNFSLSARVVEFPIFKSSQIWYTILTESPHA